MNNLSSIARWVVIGAVSYASAQSGRPITSGPHPTAPRIAAHTFTIAVLSAPGQPRPEIAPIALHFAAAFAEADEILQLKDDAADCACPFHFARGPIAHAVWIKRQRKSKESSADLEVRAGNNDVEYTEDSDEVSRQPGNIKVVGRIDNCNGKGPADLNTTTIWGCAFHNATFMIAAAALVDIQTRGAIVAHEYGHNVRNCDSDEPLEVMHRYVPKSSAEGRDVTPEQCNRYLIANKGNLIPEPLPRASLTQPQCKQD